MREQVSPGMPESGSPPLWHSCFGCCQCKADTLSPGLPGSKPLLPQFPQVLPPSTPQAPSPSD